MKTAIMIKRLDDFNGDARLYRVQNDNVISYVVVSAVSVGNMPETYIFAADSGGKVLSWEELDGSFQGELNHEKALRYAGYEIISNVKKAKSDHTRARYVSSNTTCAICGGTGEVDVGFYKRVCACKLG